MSEPERPTVEKSEMVNAHVRQPLSGSRVLALNHGGALMAVIWSSTSIQYFDAWCCYPKVPKCVKKIQSDRFKQTEEL
jgi:hypothetical protein